MPRIRRALNLPVIAMPALVACAVALASSRVPAKSGEWPQWRGPGGLGISTSRDLPETWTPATNIKWKTGIPGRGLSSPIVWGDRVFLTTSIKGDHIPGRKAPVHLGYDLKPG